MDFRWCKRHADPAGRIELRIVIAVVVALALMAGIFWMVVTGNMFCCDPDSLLGQLRRQLFTGT
jgi:hypothetical protein